MKTLQTQHENALNLKKLIDSEKSKRKTQSLNITNVNLSTVNLAILLMDGRNSELAARYISEIDTDMSVIKDSVMPTRKIAFKNGKKYIIRMKTDKGFDLAPSKMKGTQRKRKKAEALEYVKSHNFLLIDSTGGTTIRYKYIENPSEIIIKDI